MYSSSNASRRHVMSAARWEDLARRFCCVDCLEQVAAWSWSLPTRTTRHYSLRTRWYGFAGWAARRVSSGARLCTAKRNFTSSSPFTVASFVTWAKMQPSWACLGSFGGTNRSLGLHAFWLWLSCGIRCTRFLHCTFLSWQRAQRHTTKLLFIYGVTTSILRTVMHFSRAKLFVRAISR